ncbi:MAG: sulfite exporter TauE/SafE family protein [Gemmatimonadales bacterium]
MAILGYALATLIGLSLGLLGGGGSILAVPVLVYVLGFGMKQAVPMSLAVVGITSAFGVLSHHRNANIRWSAAAAFGPAAIVGAFAGARLAGLVTSRMQLTIFAVLMLAAAISMYTGPALWMPSGDQATARRPWPVVALIGGLVGMLTGLVGVGGGFLYVPSLVLLAGLPMKQAVGTSLVLIIMSCIAGFISYLGVETIDWQATGLFAALAIVGVLVGSRLVNRVSQAGLRKAFAGFLLVMGILVLLKPR